MGELLQPNTPRKFEGRNIRTPKRSGAINDLYLVQFEITREAWEALETVPKTALLEGVIWYHDGDNAATGDKPKREKKPAKPKGAWGEFWQSMFKRGALNNPDLPQVLNLEAGTDTKNVKEAIKLAFEVESLTFISPPDFARWCVENELHALATMTNQIAFE